ncbi:MAG: Lrp/AsnC family transcriptional regulator [Hyphomonadaceae bacterium]
MLSNLDAIDARILDVIQRDAGLSVVEIADQVGVSSSPCWRRIKRLEDIGVISRRVTLINYSKLGLKFEVEANVRLNLLNSENIARFEGAARQWTEVTECVRISGAGDYVLRVITTDMRAYDNFLRDKVLPLDLVADIQSWIVVNVAKRTTEAPLVLVKSQITRAGQ